MKAVLTLSVQYDDVTTTEEVVRDLLSRLVTEAVDKGRLTGNTDAQVTDWWYRVETTK